MCYISTYHFLFIFLQWQVEICSCSLICSVTVTNTQCLDLKPGVSQRQDIYTVSDISDNDIYIIVMLLYVHLLSLQSTVGLMIMPEPLIMTHNDVYSLHIDVSLATYILISKRWHVISMLGSIFLLGRQNPGHISESLTPMGRTAHLHQ